MTRVGVRAFVFVGGLALMLAACGGTPAGGGTNGPGSTSAPGGGAPTAAPEGTDPLDPFRDKDATAVVTIGGTRYEFGELYCVTFFGALSAQSIGSAPSVHIDLPPKDWETSGEEWDPPSVLLELEEPYLTYAAGGDTLGYIAKVNPEDSRVSSYDSDGFHATGTAQFVETNAALQGNVQSVSGTFEVSCPRS